VRPQCQGDPFEEYDVSSSKQRKARQQAEREQWEREQQAQAAAGRRRTVLLVALSAFVAVVVVVGLTVLLTRGGDDPEPTTTQPSGEGPDLLEEEAAGEAQAAAASEAMSAGQPVAEDFTVDPGTAVDSGERPPKDDRPVACGAKAPANARDSRPRFPGGPAQVLEDGVDYVARIRTSCGPIVIDLYEKDSPIAVNSFVFLARQGYYDGLEIYRDFGGVSAVQGGSGDDVVGWDIGYTLPSELDRAEREGYPIGTVTTAGSGPYTAGSEFLIAYGKEFERGYASDRIQSSFGRVLSGMDVIDRMTAMDRLGMGGESFAKRLFMNSVTIEER
jgi:cyclophilin family peptidyl-prolyl cis-trans isomerase